MHRSSARFGIAAYVGYAWRVSSQGQMICALISMLGGDSRKLRRPSAAAKSKVPISSRRASSWQGPKTSTKKHQSGRSDFVHRA